jgi:hypothetical protein
LRQFVGCFMYLGPFHGPCASNLGAASELSYTVHRSAKSR